MDDGLNTVPVLRMHLEEIARALVYVEGLLVSQDLQTQYKAMANVTRPSRLTQDVQRQLERVQGYLVEEDSVPDE
jgi:hypothetical protein